MYDNIYTKMKQKFRKMFLKLGLEVPLFEKVALLDTNSIFHFGII
jgi:hypothetical protein